MKTFSICLQVTHVRRLAASQLGNPRWEVAGQYNGSAFVFKTQRDSSCGYSCKLDGIEGETLAVQLHTTKSGNHIARQWQVVPATWNIASGGVGSLRRWVVQNLSSADFKLLLRNPWCFRSLPTTHPLRSEGALDALTHLFRADIKDQLEAEFGNVDSFILTCAMRRLAHEDLNRTSAAVAIALLYVDDPSVVAEMERREIGAAASLRVTRGAALRI